MQEEGVWDVLIGPEGDGLSFFWQAVFDPDQKPVKKTDFILSEQHSDTVGCRCVFYFSNFLTQNKQNIYEKIIL